MSMIIGIFQSKHTRNRLATRRARNARMENTTYQASAILPSGEADQEPEQGLDAWTPEEFDHFTDLGLLRSVDD
jgi:hypothetical protein